MAVGRINLQAGHVISHTPAFSDRLGITIYPPKTAGADYVVQLSDVQSHRTGRNTFGQRHSAKRYELYKTLDEVAARYDIDADMWDVRSIDLP